jgi:hypothetical protein
MREPARRQAGRFALIRAPLSRTTNAFGPTNPLTLPAFRAPRAAQGEQMSVERIERDDRRGIQIFARVQLLDKIRRRVAGRCIENAAQCIE